VNGKNKTWTVPVRALDRYDKLEAGRYFTTETFFKVPADWPLGDSNLFVEFQDKKSRRLLTAEGIGGATKADATGIRLHAMKVLE
jgi:hypothetical protein